ncbi:integral membrane protein [Phaeosphaeriaceae sp. PMI808]|nr:integral membrane protein [Phaeosphaeriaceae sp. PMI808]
MPHRIALTLATAVLLVPWVVAHGDESMAMGEHDAPQPQAQHDSQITSYWSLSEHAALMYWHIGFEILAWMVMLPIAVMMSISRSRFTLLSQLMFLAINASALVLGVVYDHKTPELYAGNTHSKIGWAVTWIASAWVFMAAIQVYVGHGKSRPQVDEDQHVATQSMSVANMMQYHRVQKDLPDLSRFSNDSGQGTERNSESLFGHSRSSSLRFEDHHSAASTHSFTHDEEDSFDEVSEKRGLLQNASMDRFVLRYMGLFTLDRLLKGVRFSYVVMERTILIQGFVGILTGTVVYGGIAKGDAVFNVLAHFVKGGIFFLYGLLTLGRWMGAFADFGWAWNVKPPREIVGRRRAAMPSAEFIESFVIWLYGVTNVFLEHLAAWGDKWTAQDLEHVSISVLFFGGGLLGMIVESTKIRDLLSNTFVSSHAHSTTQSESWQQPRQHRVSMNPLPALIIMLLGKMMSSHHQASKLSTMIHSQWGSMFMGFAFARGITYILLYISPPTSYLPSRLPTELITSFCLVAGGITFMVSNKDTVAVLEGYELDAMFIFTVTMGITMLLMAWTTITIAIKSWASMVEGQSQYAKRHAGVLA